MTITTHRNNIQEEFEGNVKIATTDKEVRLWVCNEEGCRFRIKARGKVMIQGSDIIVRHGNADKKLLEALREMISMFHGVYGFTNPHEDMDRKGERCCICKTVESAEAILALATGEN